MNIFPRLFLPLLCFSAQAELLVDQLHYLKSSSFCPCVDENYGDAVAISGSYAVIGVGAEDSNSDGIGNNLQNEDSSSQGAAYIYHNDGSGWVETTYLKATSGGSGELFGHSVAIDEDTIVVGARGERSNATGVNGDESDSSFTNAGAAYVFVRDSSGDWSQQAYLKASNTDDGDNFGYSVAISGDTILVGATSEQSRTAGVNGSESNNDLTKAGAVYVFERDSSDVWSQTAYLKPSNTGDGDEFGGAVALDGSVAVIGSINEDSSGSGANPTENGDGLSDSGAAYIFVRNAAGVWSEKAYLKAANPQEDAAFGMSVSVSGETVAVGAPEQDSNEGAVYVYVRSGATWVGQAILKPVGADPDPGFGASVSLSGQLLLAGAPWHTSDTGRAYLFRRQAGAWTPQADFIPDNLETGDAFGTAVALDGDVALIGAPQEDRAAYGVDPAIGPPNGDDIGSAYLFKFSRPLDIVLFQKNAIEHLIEFTAEAGLTGWQLKGSNDLRFNTDHSAATIFSELNPGYYRAVLKLTAPEEPHYFYRIELDE
ncbi:MAG: FG-GAP repeat protein [Roseibacillus sp.]